MGEGLNEKFLLHRKAYQLIAYDPIAWVVAVVVIVPGAVPFYLLKNALPIAINGNPRTVGEKETNTLGIWDRRAWMVYRGVVSHGVTIAVGHGSAVLVMDAAHGMDAVQQRNYFDRNYLSVSMARFIE